MKVMVERYMGQLVNQLHAMQGYPHAIRPSPLNPPVASQVVILASI